MKYEVIEEFNIFEYNTKTKGHKLRKYRVGEVINTTTRNRINPSNRNNLTKPL